MFVKFETLHQKLNFWSPLNSLDTRVILQVLFHSEGFKQVYLLRCKANQQIGKLYLNLNHVYSFDENWTAVNNQLVGDCFNQSVLERVLLA
jgi:hypothetical protein